MSGYVLEGPKWAGSTITWSFATTTYSQDTADSFSSYITQAAYQAIVEQALAKWQSVSGITFQQVADSSTISGAADIRFGFGNLPITTGEIGETTYYYSGKNFLSDVVIQLEDPTDKALVYTAAGLTYANTATTLYQVVLHEIGHALGMGHNQDTSSIMYPVATTSNRDLDATDISAVQALYGAPVTASLIASSSSAATSSSSTASTTQSGTLVLQGTHSQYVVTTLPDGTVIVNDTVAGRDGDQTLTGITKLQFSDGVGLVDPDGVAENISRLYSTTFGSATDVAGIQFWAAQVRAGMSMQTVANFFTQSAAFSSYAAMSNSDFVAAVYQQALGRPVDQSGLDYWTNALSGGLSRSSFLLSVSGSFEMTLSVAASDGNSDHAELYRLYKAAFDRSPDMGGMYYWTSALSSGTSMSTIAQAFLSSSEYQSTYGSLSNTDYVSALYQNVLGRSPDASGDAFWQSSLQNGMTRTQVLLNFADSAENRVNTAAVTHANWVYVG